MKNNKNQSLIDLLNNCAAVCNYCATACLGEENVKMLVNCIKLNTDCADICRLTASLLARGSEHGNHLLQECAEICQKCADECEKHRDMEHCEKCAETCYQCAQECTQTVHA
jgi:hypothetical protein